MGVAETMKRVLDGAIGEIRSVQETYLAGPLSFRPRQQGWSEMEYQLRNWQYFVWLSGDFNNEQHVHSLDKAAWAMRDKSAGAGMGRRRAAVSATRARGRFDHHAVTYEYPQRRHVMPTAGRFPAAPGTYRYRLRHKGPGEHPQGTDRRREEVALQGPGARPGMYDTSMRQLFAAIRSGQTINNGLYMAPKHDDGDSRPAGRLHGPADHLGGRDEFEAEARAKHMRSMACRRPCRTKTASTPIAKPGVTKFV